MSLSALQVGTTRNYLLTDTSYTHHAEVVTLLPGQLTAFGWLRTADPVTLFDWSAQYGDNALLWETATNGAGSGVANSLANAAVVLTTDTASGDYAIRATRVHHRYQPGKGMLCLTTGVFGASTADVTRRVGLFDTSDGVFLEQAGSELAFVVRKGASDERYVQSAWNVDRMDGSGPSKKTFDPAKTFIFVIGLEWLGVGTVNFGFFVDGVFRLCHQAHHAQNTTSVYMTTASLPVRGEVRATDTLGGTATLTMICASVISEGGFSDEQGVQFTANNGTTTVAVSTRVPVLSIRAAAAGPNSVANRGQIKVRDFNLFCAQPVLYEIVLNGSLTSPSWAAVNATYSLAEKDVAASAISGGTVIDSGYIPASVQSRGGANVAIYRDFPLVYTDLGNVQDTLSIVCTATGSAANTYAAITWQELQ